MRRLKNLYDGTDEDEHIRSRRKTRSRKAKRYGNDSVVGSGEEREEVGKEESRTARKHLKGRLEGKEAQNEVVEDRNLEKVEGRIAVATWKGNTVEVGSKLGSFVLRERIDDIRLP